MRSSSISLDGYGSKIRKVSRCRPAVSNETILATRQEIFYKSSSRTKDNCHFIIGFLINVAFLNVYFILHYHIFFRKKIIFSNVYISVNTIFECLYMFFDWERGHQLSTYTAGFYMIEASVMKGLNFRAYRLIISKAVPLTLIYILILLDWNPDISPKYGMSRASVYCNKSFPVWISQRAVMAQVVLFF